MNYRFSASNALRVLALVYLAPLSMNGQIPATPKAAVANQNWTVPRTPDGQPELQGFWTNATITPFERPAELASKAFLTPEEAAALEKQMLQNRVDRPPAAGDTGGYNEFWYDRGTKVVPSRRTSLIVDPPDGRIPPLTPEAQAKVDAARAAARQHPADGPESRSLQERCILWPTAGPPMLPSGYNSMYQIVQGPGYVMIQVEMIHDARIIPLDGSPHLPPNVRQWLGDSRGLWEGDTLVVDTTNFTNKTRFRGATENLHLVERFTRTGPDTILYQFTVDDPKAFTRSWSAEIPMTKTSGPVFEYACNEGNYAMTDILAGARAEEQKAAEDVTAKGSK
ncbi:MAG: hypothetical protein JOZ22_09345 [Acidobacteriia bacterium]|nr:hypothetical protein [Terriglobia bacterium]